MILEVEKIEPKFQPIKIIISVEDIEELEAVDEMIHIVLMEKNKIGEKTVNLASQLRKEIRKGVRLVGGA